MMLLYSSLSIFASFLFLRAESISFWNPYYGRTDPCRPDPCADGYTCQIDNMGAYCQQDLQTDPCYPDPCDDGYTCQVDSQGPYCQYIGQSTWLRRPDFFNAGSTTGRTYNNINSNNVYQDPRLLRWILRLIKLLSTILQTPADDPCSTNPCKYGGTCTADPTTNAATCDCPFPTGGDMCEDELGGCENCARKGKLVLVPMNDKQMNFVDSVAACHNMDLQMFQPKTQEIVDFAKNFLLDQRSENLGPNTTDYAYWFGLRRDDEQADFKWVEDGQTLNDLNNWTTEGSEQDDLNCADLSSSNYVNFEWGNDDCDDLNYQLCSGSFDFLPDTESG